MEDNIENTIMKKKNGKLSHAAFLLKRDAASGHNANSQNTYDEKKNLKINKIGENQGFEGK